MKRSSTRQFALALLLGAGLVAAPQAAIAKSSSEPDLGPPADIHHDLPAGQGCPGFRLLADGVGSQARTKVFRDEEGTVVRTRVSGKGYNLTYTNADTGKKLFFPPSHFDEDTIFHKNGLRTVTIKGNFGIIMFPTDVPPGPSTTQYKGRVVYTADADNLFTIIETHAKARDICAELARK